MTLMTNNRKRTSAALIALVATGGVFSIGAVLSQLNASASDGVGSLNAVQVSSNQSTTTSSTTPEGTTTGAPQTIHVYLPGETSPATPPAQGGSTEQPQGTAGTNQGTPQPSASGQSEQFDDDRESAEHTERSHHDEDEDNQSEPEHEGGEDDD